MIIQASEAFQFDTIDDVLHDIAAGKMVIVTDDADRENEGDLIMAAEKATPAAINFMTMHGRGLICVPLSSERADQLGLQRMVVQNREMYRTDFTVSVDAAKGVTTGISAHDRAATIRTIARPKSGPKISSSLGISFLCGRRKAVCCGARDTPKQPSISPAWRVCNQPACFAKSCTTTGLWRDSRS